MTRVEKSVLVMYSVEKMYGLVEDIPQYPQFLPWCGAAEVHEREGHQTVATLHINFHGIRQSFTTRNQGTPHQSMVMVLEKGPFQHLQGGFKFIPLGTEACRIQFVLEWRFASFLLEKLVGPVFHTIANTMVDAFVKRADDLYGG
ncbi:type II toxin-antitoxin system RatA family toxin [Ferrovum myxofaciens]|uniref:Ribosome association toxin RatA n=2 Tax=root TaxID=1 RepID=A0A8F3E1F4_9PROT|nr:type II toxin-antitoxin system RatA family toxin [Ferrovum myxofaciens]MBW8029249.1 ubiquinone-binding protein [Ferrovum sp.]KXW57949.1 ribosome association toxin RatA [Ferrovum myxofaciens]MBU6994464.1 type II toxin-antitoxin system RatA family toxin [Ferrovum myxofaciens]QKE38337.1 MAG: type II toxin-antitoxin system RatA family toxin [Ferrovum myxofaciens]QWY76073.1 MAG: type II toxin-antitoxin system RatA family toxin [Ferrovum myxofaciens]